MRMCELLVGLPDVRLLAVEDREGGPIVMHIEQAGERPGCIGCGAVPVVGTAAPREGPRPTR